MRITSGEQLLQRLDQAGIDGVKFEDGRLKTRGFFAGILRKIGDAFLSLTEAGRASIAERSRNLHAAMAERLRGTDLGGQHTPEIRVVLGRIRETMDRNDSLRQSFLDALRDDHLPDDDIPDVFLWDAEFRKEAVKLQGWVLALLPGKLLTEAVCLEAVQQNGKALEYVPDHLRTQEICRAAVRQEPLALRYVPEHLRTREICLEAVRRDGRALDDVPEALRNREMCLEAVRKNGEALEYVPEGLKTRDLCLEAVRNDGLALQFVPKLLRDNDPDLCLEAVRQNGEALKSVHEVLRYRVEISLAAVREWSDALRYVPFDLQDKIRRLAGLRK